MGRRLVRCIICRRRKRSCVGQKDCLKQQMAGSVRTDKSKPIVAIKKRPVTTKLIQNIEGDRLIGKASNTTSVTEFYNNEQKFTEQRASQFIDSTGVNNSMPRNVPSSDLHPNPRNNNIASSSFHSSTDYVDTYNGNTQPFQTQQRPPSYVVSDSTPTSSYTDPDRLRSQEIYHQPQRRSSSQQSQEYIHPPQMLGYEYTNSLSKIDGNSQDNRNTRYQYHQPEIPPYNNRYQGMDGYRDNYRYNSSLSGSHDLRYQHQYDQYDSTRGRYQYQSVADTSDSIPVPVSSSSSTITSTPFNPVNNVQNVQQFQPNEDHEQPQQPKYYSHHYSHLTTLESKTADVGHNDNQRSHTGEKANSYSRMYSSDHNYPPSQQQPYTDALNPHDTNNNNITGDKKSTTDADFRGNNNEIDNNDSSGTDTTVSYDHNSPSANWSPS